MRPFPTPDRDPGAARMASTRTRPALPLVRPFLEPAPKPAAPARPHPARPSGAPRPRHRARAVLRYAAAAAIVVGGYIHYCLYRNGFRTIPKIGIGFLLQVITSAIVAGALVIGRERVLRLGRFVVRSSVAVWLAGLSLSLGTLAAFGLSHTSKGLFMFREFGWQPAPQAAIALVAELMAVVLVTAGLFFDFRRPVPVPARAPRHRRFTVVEH